MCKRCFKCQQVKPLTDFYHHSKMADGHLNKCKVCTRTDTRIQRARNDEYYLAYDRQRASSEKRRELRRRVTAAYRLKYPDRTAAYSAVARAVRSGTLVRPEKCQGCEQAANLNAHHENYKRPLEVIWLCARCHMHHHHVRNVLNGEWV